ncbi:MAG: ABC transporter substrate-binding protein [Acidobacteriota bacterium]
MTRNYKAFLAVGILALAAGACDPDRPVQVGVVLPLTGQWDVYGVPIKQGIELAATHLAEDSDRRFDIALDIRDSESNAERAAELLEATYDEGSLVAIGGVTSAEAEEMVPVLDREDRIMISPSATSPRLTGISSNFFRVAPSDFREGAKMGNYAAQGLELGTVVILAAESPYANGIQDVFKTEFERYGGEVLGVIEYPTGTTDFEPFIDQVLELEPNGVYVADYAFEIAGIIDTLRERDYDGRILTTHAFNAADVIERLGENAEGVLLTQSLFDPNSDDPHVKKFVEAYRETYGEEPNLFAAQAYDAFGVIGVALKEADSRLPNDFRKGIRAFQDYIGASGPIQFDEKGDVGKFPRVYGVEEGVMVDFEKRMEEKKKELMERMEELKRRQREAARAAAQGG